jgi:ankyrin repeat protein
VKKLLIKGCDKNIKVVIFFFNYFVKDIYGKSVLDLARDSNFTVIENMLEDKTGLLELLNIR